MKPLTFTPAAEQELARRWRLATEAMISRHYGADPDVAIAARAIVRRWLLPTDLRDSVTKANDDGWLEGYQLGLRHGRNEVGCVDHDPNSGPGSDQCLSCREYA